MRTNIIFILYCIIGYSKSIRLYLPLNVEESHHFIIRTKHISLRPRSNPIDILYNAVYYEGDNGKLITQLYFHGVQLYRHACEQDDNVLRRLVMYAELNTRIVLSVISFDGINTKIEYLSELREDALERIMEDPLRFTNILEGQDDTITGRVLRSIFCRSPNLRKNEYDELDTVDDVPYLVQGRNDFTVEMINKEVNELICNQNLIKIDLSVPGTSGLRSSLKRKAEELSSSESDSE